ncbi:MAG: alpha/beta fold hydrolase [Solirubrobacteraceae bacterium]|nr:alpha/beta fold hydrolase [Solirubrobacteraceae bacterium]
MWGGRSLSRAAVVVCALALLAPATAGADPVERRDAHLSSFDGTRILTHFFPAVASRRDDHGEAPTVMLGHGWAGSGELDAQGPVTGVPRAGLGRMGVAELLNAGYNVVTWDSRGFGRSDGRAEVDHPAYEGRDAQMIIDWIAEQDEAQLDGPGDPRLGMAGGSYGGGIQLVTAGLDHRVDAITPTIAWNSLTSALAPDGDLRAGWTSLLLASAHSTGAPAPELLQMALGTLASGRVSDRVFTDLAARSPGDLIGKITAPTLITQGTADTLFTLREGVKNYEILRAAGTPVRMVWFCGGHGVCQDETGPSGQVERAQMDWLDRWLRDRPDIDTGAGFTWLADDGVWRDAPAWPPSPAAPLRAEASGRLSLRMGYTSGSVIAATPGYGGLRIPIAGASGADTDVVGAPRLTLRYRGTAWPRRDTHVFAQIVKTRPSGGRQVLGGQVSPVPVYLDGRERTVSIALEPIAARVPAGGSLELQLVDSSTLFDAQRTSGALTARVSVELPTAAGRPVPAGSPAPAG